MDEKSMGSGTSQFPSPGRIVHVFPNGDTSGGHPCPGVVCRVFGSPGDAAATINVGGYNPEGKPQSWTSLQHASKAPKGAACWTFPARV